MSGVNSVHLLGNLGADPELRMTTGGQAVLNLRLATSETYLDKNKVRQEKTEWHNIVIWGKRAEALARILTKGSRIFVDGKLRTSKYDDKEGNTRYRVDIVARDIVLSGGPRPQGAPQSDDGYEDTRAPDGGDDEIPF